MEGKTVKMMMINLQLKKILTIIVMVIIALGGLYWWFSVPNAHAVYLDGQELAVVDLGTNVEELIPLVLEQKSLDYGQELVTTQKISLEPVRVDREQILAADKLVGLLGKKLEFVTKTVALRVGGEEKVIVQNSEIANHLLDSVKQHYLPTVEGQTVAQAEFEEQVELVPLEVLPEKVMTEEEAFSLLVNGKKKMETHVVKEGESLWTIATANGLWPEDLLQANPQLTSDTLQIGQELKLVKAEPLLHVRTAWRETVKETIPYPVKVIKDSNLYRGQEKVVESGQRGQKELDYRFMAVNGIQVNEEILAERVVKEPKTRVVRQGTKTMVASRGGGGSGQLAWPLSGPITSGYGMRWGRMHEGIDIDGVTGDPVAAAEGGTVIFAGWSGNYGRMLAIDHGDGLATRYAHLSAFKASVGDKVSRGDIVGLVGATGDATGSHLHFEVRVNGSTRNPLGYLR